jgi:hypothetical protein
MLRATTAAVTGCRVSEAIQSNEKTLQRALGGLGSIEDLTTF